MSPRLATPCRVSQFRNRVSSNSRRLAVLRWSAARKAGGGGDLDRQPDDVGEIPGIVVEQRVRDGAGQGEPCLVADVGTGEYRPLWLSIADQGGGHRVASSGRRGSSSSWSLAWRRASASTASS